MIPLKAHTEKALRRPVVTWLIAALCTAAFVRLAMRPAVDAAAIVSALAVVPARLFAHPADPAQLVTLLTSCFIHAGWVHLGGNVLYLLVFGPAVESRLGHLRFCGLYLACGVAGTLAHSFADPASMVPLVGASGAIAGLLGAHLVLEPRTRVTTLVPALVIVEVASLPAAFVIGLWFLAQLASGLAPVTGTHAESIAWFAHLGGFAAGALAVAPRAVRDAWRSRSRVTGPRAGDAARGAKRRRAA